ncbi:hypothetical protein HFN49_36985 [Rhizobium leguminosarum]|uniref:hypothetical protein n=1 Tax=Rhizobium ruizarguesonis TaxID=2081791 RepID=UPI001A988A51|nr:hypothetical protein [Rhizobium ruizarguesonis]MBY5891713.1 hypothetical protein [Rhizobium leguminosarum]QSZ05140.1 hypothetical protein J3P73_31525 [Rhizobium ruizarguesonis]
MTSTFGPRARSLLDELARTPGSEISETANECRIDHTSCNSAHRLDAIVALASLCISESLGRVRLFGEIQDEIDLTRATVASIGEEKVALVITKDVEPDFSYFLTERSFVEALKDPQWLSAARAVWIAVEFAGFQTEGLSVSPWNGPRSHQDATFLPDKPRKLVRDLTSGAVPDRIEPWLLREPVPDDSGVFASWREVAIDRLALSLPSEIRDSDNNKKQVVLKGPRSAPIPIADPRAGWPRDAFQVLMDAARWVYGTPRETETKFQFLNNHLSLDWREATQWPDGLLTVLKGSLASAREAFNFHLQDQSKDALKALGDLRKSLQEEVAKAQAATRDLLGALWRDFALAGVVLALKSPTGSQISSAEVLRWVTVAAAVVLSASILITTASNWRFNWLADRGRREWRTKLYAFLSDDDWKHLVERPIAKARWVYRLALPIVIVMYAFAIYYLLLVAAPGWTAANVDPVLVTVHDWLPTAWNTIDARIAP